MNTLRGIALFMLASIVADAALARPSRAPELDNIRARWGEAEEAFAKDYPAAVIEHYVEMEFTTSHDWSKLYGKLTRRLAIAVFDPDGVPSILNQKFRLEDGVKLKKLRVFVQERPGGSWRNRVDLEKDAIHEAKLPGGGKEVRFPLPNFDEPAMVLIDIVTEERDPGVVIADFAGRYPLLHGYFRFSWPGVSKREVAEYGRMLTNFYQISARGTSQKLQPKSGKDGLEITTEFANVEGWAANPYVSPQDQPAAGVYFIPKEWTWNSWAGIYSKTLHELPLPKELKDVVGGIKDLSSDLEKVEAVAAYLDDPANFKLSGGPRTTELYPQSLTRVVRNREGDAFDKTALAYAMLREAKVPSFLVLGASYRRTALDPRLVYPFLLDASLLLIPSAGDDFLWDVGNTAAPLGEAGSDLFRTMMVANGKKALWKELPTTERDRVENRAVEWELADDGVLEGELSWRFQSWPMHSDIVPYTPAQEVMEPLQGQLGEEVEVAEPVWEPESPVTRRPDAERPALLAAQLVDEAEAHGDLGWSVAPLRWTEPEPLVKLSIPNAGRVLVLRRGFETRDTITINAPAMAASDVPTRVKVQNSVGVYECSWTGSGEQVVVQRRLRVPAQVIMPERLPDLEKLRRTWQESRLDRVVFEPAGE